VGGVTSIGQAGGEGVVSLGTQAWNIADGYTKIKILRLLIQLDVDEEIAMFGRKDDGDIIPPDMVNQRRVESFEKMIFHLRQLIGNCRFSIEKGNDEVIVAGFIERLENVENVANGIADWKINDVTKENTLDINDEHFRKCFDVMRSIKDELNFPVNRAGLIFRQSDEMDLDKIMNDIIQGG
jgi:hypothetical protein